MKMLFRKWLYCSLPILFFLLFSTYVFSQEKVLKDNITRIKKEIKSLENEMKKAASLSDFDLLTKLEQQQFDKKQQLEKLEEQLSGLANVQVQTNSTSDTLKVKREKEVKLKEVSIRTYKKIPKHLISVDTIRKQKAMFFFLRAQEAIERELWEDAHQFVNEALNLNPNFYDAWILRADIDARRMDIDKAIQGYKNCIDLFADRPASYYNLGQLYLKINKVELAMDYFNKSIEKDKSYILGYMGRASLNMELKKYKEAIPDLDAVLLMNPRFIFAAKARGVAKLEMMDYKGAIEDFDAYLVFGDKDGYVFYQRGVAKVLSSDLVNGCLDFVKAEEYGSLEAKKAIKKYCQ